MLCFSPQLTARMDLLDEHPRFTTPSTLGDSTQVFSPEKSACFTPPSLRGHVAALNTILGSSDQFLAQHSNSYSPFGETGTRSSVPEEPVESLHYQTEPPISFGDIGDIKILMTVI